MPEGPEIRQSADALERQINGKVIDRICFGLDELKKWEPRLTKASIKQVKTFGKAIVITLDNDLNIYSHNQLYGRWQFCSTDNYPQSSRQLRMAIDCQGASALLYSASDIAVLDASGLANHAFLKKVGPDVLHSSTSIDCIASRLKSKTFRNRQLGALLTDQAFVAGLGNYLRCEILYASGLHPKIRASVLTDAQVFRLARAIHDLAHQSYETGGITNNLNCATWLMKQGATFEDSRFYVFRREGMRCYHCGNLIHKSQYNGQAFYHCSICQPEVL